VGRGPDTGPYTVRRIRVLPGGNSEPHEVATFQKYAGALQAAESIAADFFDDGDFAVAVFVIDRDGVAVHRACGERPAARQADSLL
jgi:hypothetical protein